MHDPAPSPFRCLLPRIALTAAMLAPPLQAADGESWGAQWGTRRADLAFALAGSADGSLYVGSQFLGVLDAAPLGGNGTIDAAGRSTGLIVAFGGAGQPRWQRTLAATGGVEVRAASAGPGGLVVAGHFLEELSLHAGSGRSIGGADIFIQAYGSEGSPRWSHTLGGKFADSASAVAVLDNGHTVVAAEFQLSARFGEAGGTPRVLTSRGDRDVVLLELDEEGRIAHTLQLGGAGRDHVLGLAALRDGAYLALIGYAGSIALETAWGAQRFDARGVDDALLLRIEGEKGIVAAVNVGIDGPEGWYAFAAHPDGSAWLATTISRQVQLQVGNASRNLKPRGSDAVIMRLAPDFALTQAEVLGGEGTESAERLLALADGGAVLGATFNAALKVAGRRFEPDGTDVVAVRYDARVRARGAETIGGPKVQQLTALAAMPGGRYATLGLYEDTLRIGGEKRARAKAVGKTDVFLLVRPLP